ncbi:MAG: molybdenum cofactor biosynthesis protein [Desulfovibrio sp.]|uniref:molybdenum cofactor biosynthesis protein MoaE n=1 Tax=Desulfovibrio sp. TaxID=885 RepID=UPI001A654A74|nr:molybdenum cofactor biosynthesis protein MoaE [Desulfovibrio sp.]MBD5417232.1 molybdenum cofactor biosynthesis protein [Desulfovibrio sp.]
MNVDAMLAEIKGRPGFAEHVGMLLVHNGVVRGWSRAGHEAVSSVSITLDRDKLEAIRREVEGRPGIFAAACEGREGTFQPGDDILLLVVAGDVRENVRAAMEEFLERAKGEAVSKQEHLADGLPAE